MDKVAKKREKAARSATSASEVIHLEEKHPEEKVDISLLSQSNEN
jgi:hypothetical protein